MESVSSVKINLVRSSGASNPPDNGAGLGERDSISSSSAAASSTTNAADGIHKPAYTLGEFPPEVLRNIARRDLPTMHNMLQVNSKFKEALTDDFHTLAAEKKFPPDQNVNLNSKIQSRTPYMKPINKINNHASGAAATSLLGVLVIIAGAVLVSLIPPLGASLIGLGSGALISGIMWGIFMPRNAILRAMVQDIKCVRPQEIIKILRDNGIIVLGFNKRTENNVCFVNQIPSNEKMLSLFPDSKYSESDRAKIRKYLIAFAIFSYPDILPNTRNLNWDQVQKLVG
ncbi:MAG: hypothetical protein WC860_05650 [Candidatus Margulisiibacteriota bacterium]|jgi:hypothetical protein